MFEHYQQFLDDGTPPPAPDKWTPSEVERMIQRRYKDQSYYKLLCKLASLKPSDPIYKSLVAYSASRRDKPHDIDVNFVAESLRSVKPTAMILPQWETLASGEYEFQLYAAVKQQDPTFSMKQVAASPIKPTQHETALATEYNTKTVWYPTDMQRYALLRSVLWLEFQKNGVSLNMKRPKPETRGSAERYAYTLISELPRSVNQEALTNLYANVELAPMKCLLNKFRTHDRQQIEQDLYQSNARLLGCLKSTTRCTNFSLAKVLTALQNIDERLDLSSVSLCQSQAQYLANTFMYHKGNRIVQAGDAFVVAKKMPRGVGAAPLVETLKALVRFNGDYELFKSIVASLTISKSSTRNLEDAYFGHQGIISSVLATAIMVYYRGLESQIESMYMLLSALSHAELVALDPTATRPKQEDVIRYLCRKFTHHYSGAVYTNRLCGADKKLQLAVLNSRAPQSIKNIVDRQLHSPKGELESGSKPAKPTPLASDNETIGAMYERFYRNGVNLTSELPILAHYVRWTKDTKLTELLIKIQHVHLARSTV